jgi:hypothetical protein
MLAIVSSPAELNNMWTTPLWLPSQDLSPAEEKIAVRAAKKKKLFVLLREIRTELSHELPQRLAA